MKTQFKEYSLKLKHPFRVSGGEAREEARVGYLRLEAGNVVGYGEAAPSQFWGETIEMVREAAEKLDVSAHETPLVYELILREAKEKLNPPTSFLAALDMALFDAAGKKMGISVRKFLGLPMEHKVLTSHTIGIADQETIARKVQEAQHHPILKVKLGTQYDVEIIQNIRKLTDKPIRVDANEGWSKEEAVEKISWLESQGVELIEQPLPADQIEETAWVRERVNLPLIADESVRTAEDVAALRGAFDGINIKLMKCGGILEAIRMIRIARTEGMKVMIGCMIESSLAISAAAQLLPLVDYADLDGNQLISNDPFEGITVENGLIQLSGKPGLGVWPKEELFGAA